MRLEGKVAIITGGAQGFGAGIAQVFAREGAKVVVTDLNIEGAEKMAGSLPGGAIGLGGDVSKLGDAKAIVARVIATFGKLDIIVNNAGTSHRNKPMVEVTEEEFDRVFAVNVKSIYNFAIAGVPHMQENGGSIINIGSTAGIRPPPRPHLVQRLQGRGEPRLQVDGGGTGAAQDPRPMRLRRSRAKHRCSRPSWARIRRKSGRNSSPPSRSDGSRPRAISPMPRCFWPPKKPA